MSATGFLSTDGIEVRRTAQASGPVVEKLGMHFIRVDPDMAPNASQDFMRVVTPSGKVGSSRPKRSIRSARSALHGSASGAWKMSG